MLLESSAVGIWRGIVSLHSGTECYSGASHVRAGDADEPGLSKGTA